MWKGREERGETFEALYEFIAYSIYWMWYCWFCRTCVARCVNTVSTALSLINKYLLINKMEYIFLFHVSALLSDLDETYWCFFFKIVNSQRWYYLTNTVVREGIFNLTFWCGAVFYFKFVRVSVLDAYAITFLLDLHYLGLKIQESYFITSSKSHIFLVWTLIYTNLY